MARHDLDLIGLAGRLPRVGRCVRVWDRPVHVLERGAGRPVLLLHGCGSLAQELISAMPEAPGLRWIAPDRPGYGFSAPLHDRHGPVEQGEWALALLDALGIARAHVVAHSIATGAALALARHAPRRLDRLVLLAPFCRPTPHRWMPGLRLAVAPLVGRVVREVVVPLVTQRLGRRRLAALGAGGDMPPWLADMPLRHAARPLALKTAAAELGRFNAGVRQLQGPVRTGAPALAIVGGRDATAPPDWHLPWLRARLPGLEVLHLPEAGHAPHHAAPAAARQAILARLTPRPPRPAAPTHVPAAR